MQKGNYFIYLQLKVIVLFNYFSSTSNYNGYSKNCHLAKNINHQVCDKSSTGICETFFSSMHKRSNNQENKCNSMALKKKKNLSDRVVEFVLNCTNDEFQNLTVTKIASTFHVNRCYLSRKFKSDKDFTLCEFLMREKLSRSIVLLRENAQITIQELSTKMGFSNTNYFIQIFKSYFGAPPGRYREYISKGVASK